MKTSQQLNKEIEEKIGIDETNFRDIEILRFISLQRKQDLQDLIEWEESKKCNEDGDKDAPKFDQDYIKGKQKGHNNKIDQTITHLKQLKKEV